jgi:hypothetical protein
LTALSGKERSARPLAVTHCSYAACRQRSSPR